MELVHKEINVCDYSKKVSTSCMVEADIIVPDTKPDIYKILCVNASCMVGEHYIRKDKIIFSGDVKFNILYISDSDKTRIYNIEHTAPFNHQCEVSGADDDAVSISKCIVASTDFKVKNSRKLSAKGALSIDACAFSYSSVNALESVQGEGCVPFRQKQIKSSSMIVCREIDLSIADTVSLSAGEDDIEIHDFCVTVEDIDIKTVNNKAIIKGKLPSKILYCKGGELATYETEFNFTEISDLDMANSDSVLSSYFYVADVSYSANEENGETVLDTDIRVKGYIRAFEENEHTLVSNIYSPDYNYETKSSNKKIEKINKLGDMQISVKDIIDINKSGSEMGRVYYMNVYPSCTKTEYNDANVTIGGEVQTTLVYSDENGELCSISKAVPYETTIPVDRAYPDASFDVCVYPVSYGYVLGSGREIQTRTVLRVCADMIVGEEVSFIEDFKEDKNSPVDKSSQPSIIVCYPSEGADLWDYACKYNTTCEEIASVNNIDKDTRLTSGKAILIPKRQIL